MRVVKILNIIIFSAIVAGCHNRAKEVDTASDHLYFDYKITGSEEEGYINCKLQYRENGPGGNSLLIKSPGKVMVDDEPIAPDSTRKSGVFYELSKALDSFAGTHRFELMNNNGKRYVEELNFQPFSLENELPEEVKRQPFKIKLKNFISGNLRLVLIDTAFQNNGINEMVTVENGEFGITRFMLDQLKNGPIIMKLYLDDEKAIKNGSPTGGILSIIYSMERDFNLVD